MKIIKLKTVQKSNDGRPFVHFIPVDKINIIETVYGGENVVCRVNGIDYKESSLELVAKLGKQI